MPDNLDENSKLSIDCPVDDQRRYPRPFGLRDAIGAFEGDYRLFMPDVMKN
jgi:hypothetical protein